jgi:hypothetical protein
MANTFNHNDKVVITDGGSVGIGTTSPATRLHVSKTDLSNELVKVRIQNNLSYADFGTQSGYARILSGGNLLYAGSDGATYFYNSGNTVMTMNYLGNVGIGTTTPSAPLTVAGGTHLAWTAATSRLTIDRSGTVARIQNYDNGSVANVSLQWEGGNVGIGTTAPGARLNISGTGTGAAIDWSNTTATTGRNFRWVSLNAGGFAVEDLTASGANRFTIDATGNVGIGTTAPTSKLEVRGTVTFFGDSNFQAGNLALVDVTSGGSTWGIYSGFPSLGDFTIRESGIANRLVIKKTTGNVGIGTTDPTNTLDVLGSATIRNSSGGGALNIGTNSGRTQYQYITLGGGAGGTDYGWQVGRSPQTGGVINDGFYIYDIKTNNAPFVIALGGNVGIGTTSPLEKLDVRGSTYISGYTVGFDTNPQGNYAYRLTNDGGNSFLNVQGGNVGIGTTAPGGKLHINAANGDGLKITTPDVATIKMGSTNGGTSYWGFATTNLAASDFGIYQSNDVGGDPITAGTPRLYFKSNGNVGIGTTSPAQKLEVQGTIFINADGDLLFDNTSGGTGFQMDYYNGQMFFGNQAGSSWHMIMNDNGNVGIGTTSPDDKLVVAGVIKSIGGTNNGKYAQIFVNDSYAYYTTNASVIYMNKELQISGGFIGSYDGDLSLRTSGTTRIRVENSTGNVGIGTTAPNALLSISKTISSDTRFLEINNAGNNQFRSDIDFTVTAGGITVGRISSIYPSSNNVGLSFSTYGTSPSTGLHERMRINGSDGNVGIGVTSPNEKLQVGGNINAYINGGIDAGLFASTSAGSTTIALRSNGVTHFNGGNVGIGTTSPGVKLDIDGGSNGASVRVKGDQPAGAYYYGFMYDGTNLKGTTQTNIFYSGSTIAANTTIAEYAGLRIDAPIVSATGAVVTNNYGIYQSGSVQKNYFAGNVGIGTASPSAKLHVYGGSFKTELDATYQQGILNEYVSTYVTRTIFGRTGGSTSNLEIYYDIAGTEEARITRNYGVAVLKFNRGTTTDMIINGSGNVGIGTTAPDSPLEISRSQARTSMTGTAFGTLHIDGGEASSYISSITLAQYANVPISIIGTKTDTSLGTTMFFGTSNSYVSGVTNTAMAIRYDGNVGIGTTNPAYKLEVSGGAISIKGNTAGNSLRFDDSGGTSRNAIYLDTSNYLNVGNSNYAGIKLYHTATAPQANGLEGNQIAEGYGTTENGKVLAEPNAWLAVRIGTTDYAIPMYTTG